MAGNPVNAFLQGFAAVDQLETNRQNRGFQREQRSRLHTLWGREDEEYERLKLDRYRGEKAAEFDAITTEIMQEVTGQIDAAEFESTNPERTSAQQQQALKNMNDLRTKWFGSDQLHNLINEGWKRQIARDPEFGEHLSFAFGRDAAAGPLVNSREPVAGVGVMPPGRFPGALQGGVFFELNLTAGGTHGMTEQRTSASTDKLFLGQPGMAELLKVYGKDAVSDKYAVMGVLRERLGGNDTTGNPLQTQDQRQNNAQQNIPISTGTEPTSNLGPRLLVEVDPNPRTDQAGFDEQQRILQAEADALGISLEEHKRTRSQGFTLAPSNEPTAQTGVNASQDPNSSIVRNLGQESADNLAATVAQAEADNEANRSNLSREVEGARDRFISVLEGEAEFGGDTSARGVGEQIRLGIGAVGDVATSGIRGAAQDIGQAGAAASKPVLGFLGGLLGIGGDATAESVPNNAAEISEAAAAKGTPTVGESTAASPTTQEVVDKTPAPATPEVATSIATDLATNQRSGPPPPEEIYKAYMMSRAGLLTLSEVAQFKQTGRFGKSAEVKFINMGNGTLAATTTSGGVQFIQAPGSGSGGAASVQGQQRLQNLLEDVFKEVEDPGRQQQLINAFQGAATLFGIPSTSEGGLNLRANPDVINDIREGARLVAKFDEDKIQGLIDGFKAGSGGDLFDGPFQDFQLPINATSVAIGTVLAQHGILGERESIVAFRDYFQEFAGDSTIKRFGEVWLKDKVDDIEAEVTAARSEARRSDTGAFELKDDDGSVITTVKKGDDRHKVRKAIIEYIIKSASGA